MIYQIVFRTIRPGFKQPRLLARQIPTIYPPPGLSLKAPGGDSEEFAEKFQSVDQIMQGKTVTYTMQDKLKELGVPVRQRKHILRVIEMLRRGILSFEVLEKRTAVIQQNQLQKEEEKRKQAEAKKKKGGEKSSDKRGDDKKQPDKGGEGKKQPEKKEEKKKPGK